MVMPPVRKPPRPKTPPPEGVVKPGGYRGKKKGSAAVPGTPVGGGDVDPLNPQGGGMVMPPVRKPPRPKTPPPEGVVKPGGYRGKKKF